MNRKFKKMFLPAIAAGLLVFGTNGLKESAIYQAKADYTGFYIPRNPSLSGQSLKNRIRLNSWNENEASFTFIIPGLGGSAGNWSNSLFYNGNTNSIYGNEDFSLDVDSLPYVIQHSDNNDTQLYVCTYGKSGINDNKFTLKKYVEKNYSYGTEYEAESDFKTLGDEFSHHIFIYEDNPDNNREDAMQSFDVEYEHFENFANTLANDFYEIHGFIPKINLVGHSRGGLVAQRYLNDYPYNVSGIYTLATPFSGSQLGSIVDIVRLFVPNLNLGDFQSTIDSDGYKDIQNVFKQNELKSNWNSIYQYHRNTKMFAHGSVFTIPYLHDVIYNFMSGPSLPSGMMASAQPVVDAVLSMLDGINEILSPNPNNNFNLTDLVEYDAFKNICNTYTTNAMKNQMRARIRTTLDYLVPDDIDRTAQIIWIALTVFFPAFGLFARGITEAAIDEFCNLIMNQVASFGGKTGVFLDDGMVGVKSQMAEGYNGYNRCVKIIGQDYITQNTLHPTRDQYLVGHNLETINHQIVQNIRTYGKFFNFRQIFNTEINNNKVIDDPEITQNYFSYPIFGNTTRISFDSEKIKLKLGFKKEDKVVPIMEPKITIKNRTSDLHIYLSNFKTDCQNNLGSMIKYEGSANFDLYIHYSGNCSLIYNSAYTTTATPQPTIDLPNVDVYFVADSGATLTISGCNGSKGADQSNKPKASGYVNTYDGRNGDNGSNGGNGYNGAAALKCREVDFEKAKNLYLFGGNGGAGGAGGRGGDGADGKRHDNGFKGGNGGKAGNGGNGGRGGNGGYALQCSKISLNGNSFSSGNISLISGQAGKGGNGGAGGDGGHGAKGTYFWVIFRSSRDCNHDGGNGGDGGIVGRGGDAGTAYFCNINSVSDGSFNSTYTYNRSYAKGGNCGSKFGNGGNGGAGSSGAGSHGDEGLDGNAVTGWRSLHGMIPGRDNIMAYGHPSGVTYCYLNGMGRDSSGAEMPNTFMPSFGSFGY